MQPSIEVPRSREIGRSIHATRAEESDWASFGENSASLRGKSRRARGHAIFTSDFRCQANALNSMAFQRVLRGRQQCVLWKYGHWHSANIKEWAEFLLTRNSDVKKKGGKFSRRNPLKNTNSFSRNSRLSQTNFCARNCCVGRTDRHLMGSPKPRLRVGAFFIRTPRE
jgi:hypothetical protein